MLLGFPGLALAKWTDLICKHLSFPCQSKCVSVSPCSKTLLEIIFAFDQMMIYFYFSLALPNKFFFILLGKQCFATWPKRISISLVNKSRMFGKQYWFLSSELIMCWVVGRNLARGGQTTAKLLELRDTDNIASYHAELLQARCTKASFGIKNDSFDILLMTLNPVAVNLPCNKPKNISRPTTFEYKNCILINLCHLLICVL